MSWDHLIPLIPGLRKFVAKRVTPNEVDDVLQDIILRIHGTDFNSDHEGRTRAWTYSIARHAVADFYRSRMDYTGAANLLENLPDTVPVKTRFPSYAGEHSVHEEVLSWLRPMVEALPEPYRVALLMADFEGRSQREVAAHLGISLSGAKSRVQRARKRLGEMLKDCCKLEFGSHGEVVSFCRLKAGEY